MPISECYLPKFNTQPHYRRLAYSTYPDSSERCISNSGDYFQTQVTISQVLRYHTTTVKICFNPPPAWQLQLFAMLAAKTKTATTPLGILQSPETSLPLDGVPMCSDVHGELVLPVNPP